MPIGRSAVELRDSRPTLRPSASASPLARHGDRRGRWPVAVVAEHRLRRIDVAACHAGNIAQAEKSAALPEVDRLQALLGREFAGDADRDALGTGIDDAARRDGVLRLQGLRVSVDVEAERGELIGRELEVDLLVLRADEIDLGDVGNAQQLVADAIDLVAQLAHAEAVGGKGVDQRIGVAELVVEERPAMPSGSVLRMSPTFLRT